MYCIRNIPQKKSTDFMGFQLFPYIITYKICILKDIQKAVHVVFVVVQIHPQSAILISGNIRVSTTQIKATKLKRKRLDFIITAIISTCREDISWCSNSQKNKKYNQNYYKLNTCKFLYWEDSP